VWKSLTKNVQEIKGLAAKIKNFTSVQIDAELLDSTTDTVQDWSIAPEDIIIIEAPKKNSVDWVFQSTSQAKEEVKISSSESWEKLDLTTLFDGKSKRGLTGLGNLGNTCFMNSGLQCLANSTELTNYFLFGKYKSDINKSNPLGMGGKLATAYAGLMQEMWCGGSIRLAPIDLKKTLGSKISRFSGYG
jgi:ubiquitin C-terminal hydrolase